MNAQEAVRLAAVAEDERNAELPREGPDHAGGAGRRPARSRRGTQSGARISGSGGGRPQAQ